MLLSNLKNEYRVWSWYSKSMGRRGRVALSFRNFFSHFNGGSFYETFRFGNETDGFLLGVEEKGLFVPTHFAPKTLRGGYRLFGELKSVPSLLAVTDDLAETLGKMKGWYRLPLYTVPCQFRGEAVSKEIMINLLGIKTLLKYELNTLVTKVKKSFSDCVESVRERMNRETIVVSGFSEEEVPDLSGTFIMDDWE